MLGRNRLESSGGRVYWRVEPRSQVWVLVCVFFMKKFRSTSTSTSEISAICDWNLMTWYLHVKDCLVTFCCFHVQESVLTPQPTKDTGCNIATLLSCHLIKIDWSVTHTLAISFFCLKKKHYKQNFKNKFLLNFKQFSKSYVKTQLTPKWLYE